MEDPVRKLAPTPEQAQRLEWLVPNGLGGYASGTLWGAPSRRYHGLLVAALPNPMGRVMMLGSLATQVRMADGSRWDVGWVPPVMSTGRALDLVEVRVELGLPIWVFRGGGITLERRVVMIHAQNTTMIGFQLVDGGPVRVEMRPALQFRGHDDPVSTAVPEAYPLQATGARIELLAPAPLPNLRFRLCGDKTSLVIEPMVVPDLAYQTEASRGYAAHGTLYSPGRFRADLPAGGRIELLASTEPWDALFAMPPGGIVQAEIERRRRLLDAAPPRARTGPAAELVLAADAFVIRPAGRRADHIRARAAGDEAYTVIAGYHWFTDWGRDTMISLEGLTLATGRIAEAGSILRMFALHVQGGLVPNLFPEGASDGLYHTADATLWFFHAIDRYLRASEDQRTLRLLFPLLRDIIDHHVHGTRFGIHVDPADGLLVQGAPGYQLTWMDAKAGDWVVTPRRGKAVEICALWYNALRLMVEWGASDLQGLAAQACASFNARFWNPDKGCLYDVVDGESGNDPAVRPNQLFAISLPHPVLARDKWAPVLATVERELLVPVGLRSLSPASPDYKPSYHGDLLTRDAAYHQGTAWSWLIGPYLDALAKVRPDDLAAGRRAVDGLVAHLGENCLGYIGEVFDAEAPFAPGGCVAQAWGVAELLRGMLLLDRVG